MEIKKKEKEAKAELLLQKRKTESLNLKNHGANVNYIKQKILKNIINNRIINNTTETNDPE